MTKILTILLAVVTLVGFTACEFEDFDTEKLTDFAPGMAYAYPADGGKIVKGNFDIVMAFADGKSSPLAGVDLILTDSADAEMLNTSAELSGTLDTLKVPGADFNASDLEVGAYKLQAIARDSKGQETTITINFEISKLPYAANHDEMYLAGEFNGWSWDSLILVSDHMWEVKNVDLEGGMFKFKNTKDWSDQDWGDPDCNGVMDAGGADTDCGYSGLANIRFNDETLQYTIVPAVNLESNLASLYLLGNFNDFQGSEYEFTATEDHVWVLEEVVLKPGFSFKFSEGPYSGRTFGDIEPDSIADESAPNIVFPATAAEGVYSINFNDETLEYSFTFVRSLFPDELFLVGNATTAGWDPTAALQFTRVAEGKFEIVADLVIGEFKFLQERDWAGDWGMGASAGVLEQDTESNIVVEADGSYKITVDFTTNSYTVASAVPADLFLVGGSTSAGWTPGDAVQFAELSEGVFRLYAYLTVEGDGFKFLEVRDWAGDWGMGASEGVLEQDTESNVTVSEDGFYRIDANFNEGTYSITASNWGIIGDATPSGWEADTDMTLSSAEKGSYTWTMEVTLTDGEVKFRENDAWDINLGDSGADGSLEYGGDNIAVSAGAYTVQLILDPVNGYTYTIE